MLVLLALSAPLVAHTGPSPIRIGVGIGIGVGAIVLGLSMIFQWWDWTFNGQSLNKTAWQVIGGILCAGGIGGGIAIAVA
jgi:hypothetical protein